MARLLRKWWAAPLVPLSYYAASRLTTQEQDSSFFHHSQPQTVTREQFKKGHLINEFLRFIPDKDGDAAGKLELSIVRYKERLPGQFFNPNFVVDLVSVVHMGDRQYYKKLQKRLESYDSVIYEGVTGVDCTQNVQDFDNACRKGARFLSLVRQEDSLELSPSWKHGDLNWSTFLNLEKQRGRLVAMTPLHERILTSLQQFGYVLSSLPWPVILPFPLPFILYIACSCKDPVLGSVDTLEDMLKLAMFSGRIKFWVAWFVPSLFRSIKDVEDASGLAVTSVIIGERNKVAIKELKGAMKRGEHSIAILYGAAHMPDFHKRLTEDFNLVPTSVDWITAWSVEEGPKSKCIQPFLDKFASDKRTPVLASLIFATLVAHISAWQAFGIRYWCCLILINILVVLINF